ncbi:unnamed protein product, partial [Phaeothamnion confervicola]
AGVSWGVVNEFWAGFPADGATWRERSAAVGSMQGGLKVAAPSLLRSVGRSSASFATVIGVLNGVSCSMEKLRGERDWRNQAVGGFAAGALIAMSSRNPTVIMSSALGTALLAGALHNVLAPKQPT